MSYYQQIIQANLPTILDLYENKKIRKTVIANQLLETLQIKLSRSQGESFSRTLRQFLRDYKEVRTTAPVVQSIDELQDKFPNAIRTKAKILLVDTETTPILALVWGLFKQNLNIEQVVTDSHLICWTAKWLFEPEMLGDCLTSEEAKTNDDLRICKSIWQLMEEADVIIAHNAKRFDVALLNGRFFVHGMPPPSPFEIIDTLEVARKKFKLTSNKLDFINRIKGITTKLDTKFILWVNCFNGEQDALDEMFAYCKNDTAALEETYMELRPWVNGHPNMAFYVDSDKPICPTCGGDELVEIAKPYRTGLNEYMSYRCGKCGSLSHGRKTIIPLSKKPTIIASNNR